MNKLRKLTSSAKKATGSLVLLLVFLLPIFLSANWIYQLTGGVDTRTAYADSEIAAFRTGDYTEDGELMPFDEPIVTVTFDDGWESVYTEAFPLLEKYNVKTTQYILAGLFDDHTYLSEEQVMSMKNAGHEIAGHTMTHRDLTTLQESDIEWELGECDRLLTSKFGDIREFASPMGASNPLVLSHMKNYYRSQRNTVGDPESMQDGDINVRENFDPYNINAFTIRNTTTLEELQRYIDYTVKRKGWMVITYHQVEDDSPSEYNVTPGVLEAQMKLIRSNSIRTATIGQVLDATERNR